MDELTLEITQKITPSKIVGQLDIKHTSDGVILINGDDGITLNGNLIKKRLKDCHKAIVFVATLGLQSEKFLAYYKSETAKNVVADSLLSAYIEDFCDEIEREIRREQKEKGLCVSHRFSSGYSDFDLSSQQDILRLLNAKKLLGVGIKESYMLVPNKTVTAIMGIKNANTGILECQNTTNEDSCLSCHLKKKLPV